MHRPSPVTSWNPRAERPRVSRQAYVDPAATLIGRVVVGPGAAIWPGVVLRADEGSPIRIGAGSNVQDGVIMHCLKGSSITVGRNCSIAHGALIHGPASLGDGCFVGFQAQVFKARVGRGCFLSGRCLIKGVRLPPGRLVPEGAHIDTPAAAAALGPVPPELAGFAREVIEVNHELRDGYRGQET